MDVYENDEMSPNTLSVPHEKVGPCFAHLNETAGILAGGATTAEAYFFDKVTKSFTQIDNMVVSARNG